jgi:hypothetical protein
MKMRILLLTATIAALFLTAESYKHGPSTGPLTGNGNHTGGPGSDNGCVNCCTGANCHAGPSAATQSDFVIRRKISGPASEPVTQYNAGEDYYVTVKVTNSDPDQIRYGFQLEAVGSDQQSKGTFLNIPPNIVEVTKGGRKLLEHGYPIFKAAETDSITFIWRAPVPSVGNVTFYGIVISVDDDGSELMDQPGNPLSVVLGDPLQVSDMKKELATAYPNPFSRFLNVKFSVPQPVMVFDMTGCIVFHNDITCQDPDMRINTENWRPGTYILHAAASSGEYRVLVLNKL